MPGSKRKREEDDDGTVDDEGLTHSAESATENAAEVEASDTEAAPSVDAAKFGKCDSAPSSSKEVKLVPSSGEASNLSRNAKKRAKKKKRKLAKKIESAAASST